MDVFILDCVDVSLVLRVKTDRFVYFRPVVEGKVESPNVVPKLNRFVSSRGNFILPEFYRTLC